MKCGWKIFENCFPFTHVLEKNSFLCPHYCTWKGVFILLPSPPNPTPVHHFFSHILGKQFSLLAVHSASELMSSLCGKGLELIYSIDTLLLIGT